MILSRSLPRHSVPAQEGVVLLHGLHRGFPSLRVVLNCLIDDLLLLGLLLRTQLILQPKDAGLRGKLLLPQGAKQPRLLPS